MKQIKAWEKLTIKDHFIFEGVMRQEELYRAVLQCALNRPIPELAFPPQAEKTIKAKWQAKGVRLDMFSRDAAGNVYDLELQNRRKKPYIFGLRSRYYQSTNDQDMLSEG